MVPLVKKFVQPYQGAVHLEASAAALQPDRLKIRRIGRATSLTSANLSPHPTRPG
jgi:hypothetical protein